MIFIKIVTTDYPNFQNLEEGMDLKLTGEARVMEVKQVGRHEEVLIKVTKLSKSIKNQGNFARMARAVERALNSDGSINVNTGVRPWGGS